MRALVIAAVALLVGMATSTHSVGSAPPFADRPPRGMVAFVTGDACPPGWQAETPAAGRLLVGAAQAGVIGRVVGTALEPEEDRAHVHAVASATIVLPYKSISAANGTNQQGAAATAQPVTGTASPATSGLPMVQLTTCVSP
jgi:hypothetical protein